MPIPFIIAGAAAVAGAYGAKKSYDAYQDNSTAQEHQKKAEEIYNKAQKSLNDARVLTNKKLEEVGLIKVGLYDHSFPKFISEYEKIKGIDFKNKLIRDLGVKDDFSKEILAIKEQTVQMHELAGGTLGSLGAGALAGLGAYGGAGVLATASTGTAISSLSGVAATNATLAWFGGGALSAGGLGMAGGTAVLGGIVAGPVLAVAGGLLASKAEKMKYDAYANYDKAKAEANEMDVAKISVNSIYIRSREFIQTLTKLREIFELNLAEMTVLVNRENYYEKYNQEEEELVCRTQLAAVVLKRICDTALMDQDGEITSKSKEVIEDAKNFIKKLESI